METRVCGECDHHVDLALSRCPLCGARAPEQEPGAVAPYPSYQGFELHRRRQLALRISNFVFAVACVAVLVVNLVYQANGWWALTVLPVLVYGWITFSHTVLSEGRLAFRLMIQVYALSVLLPFLDWRTGWHGWGLTFAVPTLLTVSLIAAAVLVVVARHRLEFESILGFIAAIALGAFVVLSLWFTGWLTQLWPALTAALVGVAAILMAVVFFRKEFVWYFKSHWHI